MKKTYIYYSKSNQDVFAVIASDAVSAAQVCMDYCKSTCKIITDDYVLMSVLDNEIGLAGSFRINY